ncbi:MAG: hypothetical protein KDA79_06255 [Planctomycetaceae bacterium]|nr:hypothetical protein [Planctomycetaceae bacterium]
MRSMRNNRLAGAGRITAARKGAFIVLALGSLIGAVAMVALSVDVGVVSLTRTQMQNAVDAAALAAAQEISAAVEQAGNEIEGGGNVEGQIRDVNAIAESAARLMAAHVAELNGIYVDPDRDVRFGKRVYNAQTELFDIVWDATPSNVVQVTARKDNPVKDQPDSELQMFFSAVLGDDSMALVTSATAFVEARDIVVVLDFSGSMNYDSQLRSDTISRLGQDAVEENLRQIWEDLGSPQWGNMPFEPGWVTVPTDSGVANVTWRSEYVDIVSTNGLREVQLQFTNGTYRRWYSVSGSSGTFSYNNRTIEGCWVRSNLGWEYVDFYSNSDIRRGLGLSGVSYPYPSGSWEDYIEYARDYSSNVYYAGYRRKFGIMTFMNYLMERRERFDQTPVLWKTRQYPFHAVKEGTTLFTQFLAGLEFGDHLGLVSYDTYSRVEDQLNGAYVDPEDHVDIRSEPVTSDYAAINRIQRHKQAAHYYSTTNIGGGLEEATQLLQNHGRYGARPTIILMTDGQANVSPSGYRLPNDWDWSSMTDYDGDGVSDYSTGDRDKQYAFGMAKLAIDQGYTIHTMSVGAGADRDLMRAIAFAGGGININIPGGGTVAEMQDELLAAFSQIAANVPPAKLAHNPDDMP